MSQATMTYEEFKAEWLAVFNSAANYTTNQIGYSIHVGRLADLAEAHPEYEERLLTEAEQAHYGS